MFNFFLGCLCNRMLYLVTAYPMTVYPAAAVSLVYMRTL